MAQSVRLSAGRGVAWWGEGYRLFRQAPGVWVAITIIWLALLVGLSTLPLGGLLTALVGPVLTAGIMRGCDAVAQGRGLQVSHLFAGFTGAKLGPLLGLGAVTLIATVVILLATVVLAFVFIPNLRVFAEAVISGAGVALPAVNARTLALLVLIASALYLPLTMALWFAPALVELRGEPAWSGLRASLIGCARNWLAFLVYGLIALPLLLLAALPLLLGLLVFAPVAMASIYSSYREIFTAD